MGYSAILVDKDNISETVQLEVSTPGHTHTRCAADVSCVLFQIFSRDHSTQRAYLELSGENPFAGMKALNIANEINTSS
jgi:hypothetical protein